VNLFAGLAESAFEWTWKTSVQVTPLILLVLLLQWLLGGRLALGLRHALSFLVLVGLLLPASPASPFSVANFLPTSARFGKGTSVSRDAVSLAQPPGSLRLASGSAPETRLETDHPSGSFDEAASLAWVLGCVCLAAIAAWRHRRWQGLLKRGRSITEPNILDLLERAKLSMGVRRPIALAAVDRLSSPAVFGLWRVRLLLPEAVLRQLSLSELRLVLLHELAHVKRNDLLLSWVLMGLQFLHWFNPLIWLALRRLRADRELMCDAVVLQKIEPGERVGYGQVLLKLAEGSALGPRVFSGAVPVVSGQREIKRRIVMIRHYRTPGWTARFGTLTLAVALGWVTLTRAKEDKADPDTIPRPTEARGTNTSNSRPLVINIDSLGRMWLGQERRLLSIDQLKTELMSELHRDPGLLLSLSADPHTPMNQLVKVYDVARESKPPMLLLRIEEKLSPADTGGNVQPAAVVAKVEVAYVGPQRVEAELMHTNIHVKVGEPIRPEAVDADVRNLYETGLFYNVRATEQLKPEGMILTYIVQCRPRLSEIRFNGNAHFRDAELRKRIGSRVGGLLDERKAFGDTQVIQSLHEQAGYKGTVVKYTYVIDSQSGDCKLAFEIVQSR
jgi:beta-lactamase regulating signal transducer with metallopeptidase domain